MEYTETPTQAARLADRTLQLIDRYRLARNPTNFSVLYNFVAGRYPGLERRLKEMTEGEGTLTDQGVAELFRAFFQDDAQEMRVETVAEQLRAELAAVLGQLERAGDGAAAYGEALSAAEGALAGGGDLSTLVARLLAATRRMEGENRDLQGELQKAAGEIDKLKDDLAETRHAAMTDALTGVYNRRMFDFYLRRAVDEARAEGTPLALLMIDIDRFKAFNDNHGHQVGDRVLRLLARTLSDCIKGQDTAARYGGEEFGVILPRTAGPDAERLAESIRRRVAQKHVVNRATGENLGRITVSIGVASLGGTGTLTDLLMRADEALYAAKNGGRDRVVVHERPAAGVV